MENITQTCISNKSQCTKIAIKWERLHSLGKNLLSLLFFLWATMLHSTFYMTAVVKHSISFYQPFFSNANSWGWSLLLLTVSHTRIWWLRLGFGELALQGVLPWPFLFIWPAVFVSNLLLAKWVALKWTWEGHCSHPDVPSADFSLGFSTSAPDPPHTLSLSGFVSPCPNIYDNISNVWTFFSLPRQLLMWLQ